MTDQLIEAISAGKPAVFFNHKGHKVLHKGHEGLFYNPANPIFEMTAIEIYEQAQFTT